MTPTLQPKPKPDPTSAQVRQWLIDEMMQKMLEEQEWPKPR